MVFSANKWFAKKRQDKCLILFNQIGIETNRNRYAESESIKFKRYPTLAIIEEMFKIFVILKTFPRLRLARLALWTAIGDKTN